MPHTSSLPELKFLSGALEADIALGEATESPAVQDAVKNLILALGGANGRLSVVLTKPEPSRSELPRKAVYGGTDPTDQMSPAPRVRQEKIWE